MPGIVKTTNKGDAHDLRLAAGPVARDDERALVLGVDIHEPRGMIGMC